LKVTIFVYFVGMKCPLLLAFLILLLVGTGSAQAPHGDSIRSRADSAGQHQDTARHAGTAKVLDSARAGAAGSTGFNDDGFDPGIFFIVLILAGIIAGAAIVGSMAAALLLLALFLMASAGILSAGVMIGFYRRSATAGFRTVCYLACMLSGVMLAIGTFFLANHFFHLHFAYKSILLMGAGGGLLGGLLLGFLVFQLIKLLFRYFRERLAL
jgi:hypothetical protein